MNPINKHKGILIVCSLLLLVGLGFLLIKEDKPSFLEMEMKRAFQRHAAIFHRARLEFGEFYNEINRESGAVELIEKRFCLKEPLVLKPRPQGGYGAQVDLPEKYARLNLFWDDTRELVGYAWELDSPAWNPVEWRNYLESFGIDE